MTWAIFRGRPVPACRYRPDLPWLLFLLGSLVYIGSPMLVGTNLIAAVVLPFVVRELLCLPEERRAVPAISR